MSLHPLLPEILSYRDFNKLARVTNAELSSGTRAAVLPNMAAVKAQLPNHHTDATRSMKRARTVLRGGGLLILILVVASTVADSALAMTLLGMALVLFLLALPATLGRTWYLTRKDHQDQQLEPGLPVLVNDTRDPSELALLHQLCAFHDYTHQCGYPIPVDRWHALVREAQIAMESGNLAAAQRVSAQINEWVIAAEAANEARRNF